MGGGWVGVGGTWSPSLDLFGTQSDSLDRDGQGGRQIGVTVVFRSALNRSFETTVVRGPPVPSVLKGRI